MLTIDPRVISVIVPTHNRGQLVGRALESIAGQTYRPIEVLVVDDASDDSTPAVLEQAKRELESVGVTVVIRRLPARGGVSAARNVGLGLARGTFLAFLDSDDAWQPGFLSTAVELLDRHPDCGVAFTGVSIIAEDGAVTGTVDLGIPGDADQGVLRSPILCPTRDLFPWHTINHVLRKDVLDEVGWFDEALSDWEDIDLYFRIGRSFDAVYTREPLALHRSHSGNMTLGRADHALDFFRVQLTVILRYLDGVTGPEARRDLARRGGRAQVLLQEQLLREGSRDEGLRALTETPIGSPSLRYRLGRSMIDRPLWVGRVYASAIRVSGDLRRGLARVKKRSA